MTDARQKPNGRPYNHKGTPYTQKFMTKQRRISWAFKRIWWLSDRRYIY